MAKASGHVCESHCADFEKVGGDGALAPFFLGPVSLGFTGKAVFHEVLSTL